MVGASSSTVPSPQTSPVPLPLVTFQVACSKLLHEPVDLLGLPRQPEAFQENPQSGNKVPPTEVQLVHVAVHHLFVELGVLPQELAHLRLSGAAQRAVSRPTDTHQGTVQVDGALTVSSRSSWCRNWAMSSAEDPSMPWSCRYWIPRLGFLLNLQRK